MVRCRRAFATPDADLEATAMAKKTSCPITRAEFRAKAKPVAVTIGNHPMEAEVKEFSTGSLGWYLNGKVPVEVDGVRVSVQIGLSLTIVGSKELPPDKEDEKDPGGE
jgi:hypothetical protein